MFTLINSLNLEIIFDTVSVEEQLPSVAFDITANWKMPYQQAQIVVKECWLEYSELNQFEGNIQQLLKRQNDSVKLSSLNSKSILQFNRIDDEVIFEFTISDNFELGTIIIRTDIPDQELIEIIEKVKTWAKWW